MCRPDDSTESGSQSRTAGTRRDDSPRAAPAAAPPNDPPEEPAVEGRFADGDGARPEDAGAEKNADGAFLGVTDWPDSAGDPTASREPGRVMDRTGSTTPGGAGEMTGSAEPRKATDSAGAPRAAECGAAEVIRDCGISVEPGVPEETAAGGGTTAAAGEPIAARRGLITRAARLNTLRVAVS